MVGRLSSNDSITLLTPFTHPGYNQGVFSGVLPMTSFNNRMGPDVQDAGKKGWLVAILELGAWVGVLVTGRSHLNPRFLHLHFFPFRERVTKSQERLSARFGTRGDRSRQLVPTSP